MFSGYILSYIPVVQPHPHVRSSIGFIPPYDHKLEKKKENQAPSRIPPKMSKKNRKTAGKSSERGTVGVSTCHLDAS